MRHPSLDHEGDTAACEDERRVQDSFVVRLVWAPVRTALVVLAGEVDYFTSACLRDVVDVALNAGAEAMVINLCDVTFLDASGLSVAVAAARALGPGNTCIVCPDQRVVRVFRVTALDRVLTICDTPEEALAALECARRVTPRGCFRDPAVRVDAPAVRPKNRAAAALPGAG